MLVGLPYVAVFGLILNLIFRAFGYHYGPDRPNYPSILAIMIGTFVVFRSRSLIRKFPLTLCIGALAGYIVLGILIWARATNRLTLF